MYVLDTNAFYYAAEISSFTYRLDKLQKLIMENETFISSTSFFEFVVKNRQDFNIIQKGINYIKNNNIKIVGNVINPLPAEFDLNNFSYENYNHILPLILENKIDVESRFVSVIFSMCLFSAFYFTLNPKSDSDNDFGTFVMHNTFKMFSEKIPLEFKNIFKEGYKTDDCETYVKEQFYELLGAIMTIGIAAIDVAKENGEEEKIVSGEWLPKEAFSLRRNKISGKLKNMSSNKLLHEIAISYKKSQGEKKYRHVVEELSKIFNSKIKFSALQEYTYDILINIFEHGMALWKNDLLDAIILCNLQEQHILITYDNGLIKRMTERQGQHEKYRQSIEIIAELKK